MYIDQLELKNFRMFADRTFKFDERFNILIGQNGSGKTTVLKALRIIISSFSGGYHSRYKDLKPITINPDFDIKRDATGNTVHSKINPCQVRASVDIGDDASKGLLAKFGIPYVPLTVSRAVTNTSNNNTGVTGIFEVADEWLKKERYGDNVPYPLTLFLGTGRLWNPTNKKQADKIKHIGSRIYHGYVRCCDNNVETPRALSWFASLYIKHFKDISDSPPLQAAIDAVATCFSEWQDLNWSPEYNQLAGMINGKLVIYDWLSDGQQVVVNIVLETIYRASVLNPDPSAFKIIDGKVRTKTNGVLLIDEIDMHLHPTWQRTIRGQLLEAFPYIQIFATTHAPLVIQSCEAKELVFLDKNQTFEGDPRALSANYVLNDIQNASFRSKDFTVQVQAVRSYHALLRDAESASDENTLAAIIKALDEQEDATENPAVLLSLQMQRYRNPRLIPENQLSDETNK